MRIAGGCLLAVVATAVLAPASQDFRNLYGNPDIERFAARPGISVTVQYGSDQCVCQAIIEPPQQLLHSDEEELPLMSSEAVTEILEVISPTAERGTETSRTITASGCNEFAIFEYENVSIMCSTRNCLPAKPEREVLVTVAFKRSACPKRIPVKPPGVSGGDAAGAPPKPPNQK